MDTSVSRLQPAFWAAHFVSLTTVQKLLRTILLLVVFPSAVIILVLFASNVMLRALPKMGALWFVYGIPSLMSAFAWTNLYHRYGEEHDRLHAALAVGATTIPVLIGLWQASYVQFVGDLTFETWTPIVGLMLLSSLVGFIATLLIAMRSPRWFSILSLGAATWMLTLSVLFGIAT